MAFLQDRQALSSREKREDRIIYSRIIVGKRFSESRVNPSKVPALAEPWFLVFEADVKFHVVMSPEELGRAGLEAIAKKW